MSSRSMGGETNIGVSVAFAMSERQAVIELSVPTGTSLDEAVAMSGIHSMFPGVDMESLQKGIWYEKKSGDTILNEGDRIEIYRPLLADAKEARRLRAEKRRQN